MNLKASTEAESFIQLNEGVYYNLSREQAYLVHKFFLISEELMVKGLIGLIQKGDNLVNRLLLKHLHPDKNPHPQAKDAFQRVQHAMETVKARIPVQCSA